MPQLIEDASNKHFRIIVFLCLALEHVNCAYIEYILAYRLENTKVLTYLLDFTPMLSPYRMHNDDSAPELTLKNS